MSDVIPRVLLEYASEGFRFTTWTRYGETQGWHETFAAAALQAGYVIAMHEQTPTPFPAEGWEPIPDMPRYDHCQYCGSGRVFVNDEGYCDECDERLADTCDRCGAKGVPMDYYPEYGAMFCDPCGADPQAGLKVAS